MELDELRERWDRLAADDPLWAVLTDPAKRGQRWDPAEFFATGREEIASVMRTAESLGYPAERSRALDFGCGVGRLTQALAGSFGRVTGVDVSPAMLELARQFNTQGERCEYILNTADNLRRFSDSSFDLIYCRNVLQHSGAARHARSYVREFARVLRPSGLGLFQLPSRLRSSSALSRLGYRLNRTWRKHLLRRGFIDMCGVPREIVIADLEAGGARVLRVEEDGSAGPEWTSFTYAFTR